ncbi:glucose transporter GlcU [Bacillus sp. FJAT-27916]|uniref:GRP family sugar transporter n=1 Tax=Bacillus sp. FJAT-27916 TaxID=1679169 RepID=UPI00067123AB|nr:GRP family sugar transporter [Bacillus sp. FJAT-27916]KMY43977.1 glucose transporter GlcU [Bacillus sp. FJAT-27916]
MEGILYALLPALAWGSLVLVSEKLGGDPKSQTLGITTGSLLFGLVMYFIQQPDMSMTVWIVGIISGAGWAVGQLNQFNSVKNIGVSKTVPISTGLQLLGTTFFGVVVFKEWSGTMTIVLGLLAIAAIIAGIIMTGVGQGKDSEEGNKKKGAMFLGISTVGFVLYVVIVRWYDIDGWAAILPQGVGMFIATLLLSIKDNPFNKYMVRNVLTGIMWAIGNIGLLLANPLVGVAIGFSFSQMGIIISTLGGIFLLGEKKSKKQLTFIIIGCALVIAGGVMLGFTKE